MSHVCSYQIKLAVDRLLRLKKGEDLLSVYCPKSRGEQYTNYAHDIACKLRQADKERLAEAYLSTDQVCRQLLAAMDENERLVARFAKLETLGCTCGDGDCEAGDCYGCRGQMNLILRDELDEANSKLDLVTSNFHILLNERFLENSELRQRAESAEMRMKELLDALRLCKLYGSQGDIDDGRKGAVSVSYYVDKAIDAAEAALATTPPADGAQSS